MYSMRDGKSWTALAKTACWGSLVTSSKVVGLWPDGQDRYTTCFPDCSSSRNSSATIRESWIVRLTPTMRPNAGSLQCSSDTVPLSDEDQRPDIQARSDN